jgi:signal transduction histidine kinase
MSAASEPLSVAREGLNRRFTPHLGPAALEEAKTRDDTFTPPGPDGAASFDHSAGRAPARARRRSYLALVASTVIGAYTTFVLINTHVVGFDTYVPLLPWLFLQDGLDIVAAAALVIFAVVVLDRLLERDQQHLLATLEGLARVTRLARRTGDPAAFREQVRPIERGTRAPAASPAGTFGEMLTHLERAVEGQRQLLFDTSHELRNPLMSLSMNLALLQREDLSPELLREAARDSQIATARMQRLVNDLLLLARGDMSEVLQLEVVKLESFVAEVARGASRAGAAPIHLGTLEPAIVLADSVRLWQILCNVVENAQRHTPPEGSITLSLRLERDRPTSATGTAGDEGDWAVITCLDTGTGIAPEHLPYVFDRFYQADPARSSGGSGLGLTIVKHLVEAHQGRVALSAELGKGTLTTIYLPLAHDEA